MKIALFSAKSYDREYFDKINKHHNITYFEAGLNKDTASLTQGFEGVCVFVNDNLDKETIEKIAANGIQVIALRCAGFNNVDMAAAHNRNIKVVRVPAYSPEAVAEHAAALILTLNRKTHKAYNRVRESNFSLEKLTGFNLHRKTVGVIGTGIIGRAFCHIMLGFGCRIIAYDMYESDELKSRGATYTSLDELFKQADIISLHCPLTPETKHIINEHTFGKMKDGVMLINTGRGALINTKDAIKALKDQKLGYLGIDVYEQETNIFFRDLSEEIMQDEVFARLMTFPNVLVTAHQAFFTGEALEQISTVTLQNLTDFENGRLLVNEVNA
ncbi:2-hydroxyacid dehydrogenase [Parafilimonas sp.]|uniref:2-hydroxyacid dehydrogenase n=1 Tax=Parafilimonas sp. TaxID=1969739 RepID=UPI0039E4FE7B